MPRPPTTGPTDRELAILQILWDKGPGTVRQTTDALNQREGRQSAYNTVLTLLQIMHDKGYVSREEQGRAHLYTAAQSRDATQGQIVTNLVERVFEGSAMNLVIKALKPERLTLSDRRKLQELLEDMEKET